MKNIRIVKNILLGGIGLSALLGCGSSGNGNDQGVSFTLFGVFQDNTCSTGLTSSGFSVSDDGEANGSGIGVRANIGLQNNMAQAIRTRRAFMQYFVEGAEVQIPPTSQALGVFLGPGTPSENSSLPESLGGAGAAGGGGTAGQVPAAVTDTAAATMNTRALANVSCPSINLVPPEILSYISLNRSSFPELPFSMRVEVSVYGIGTAGDEYTSNPIDVSLTAVQDNIITPSPGDIIEEDTGTSLTELSELEEAIGDGVLTGGNTEVIPVN